jgi:Asp-tRNA(Asn)/Glu-tRNA(Gln) amidotransferase A subunit family amidase
VPKEPYASFAVPAGGAKPLSGVRIGIVREYMVKHAANDRAMSDQIDAEIKRVLRDELGAELVESFDPLYADDPTVPNMKYDFRRALAEILPQHMPQYLAKEADGKRLFAVEGYDIADRDFLAKAAEGELFLSDKLNLRSINRLASAPSFSLHMATYLKRRGDARVFDWATLNANTKNYEEGRTVAMKNWESKVDVRSDGMPEKMAMREVMRTAIFKVMYENDIDVFVNPTITVPAAKNGYASQPQVNDRPLGRFPLSANAGIPEITVPAGFNRIIYEPAFALNEKKDRYISVANETQQTLMDAAMPIGISFWGGPGDEPAVLEIAATYEAATKHRAPPPAFGPLRGHE